MSWVVYVLRCVDGTFYTGITTDLERRLKEHNETNRGAKYTKLRRPVKLHYKESQPNRSTASQREYVLRRLPKTQKQKLQMS